MAITVTPTPKKSAIALQHKRHGTHRRHTKPYIKPYWPYLPLLLIVGVGIIANLAWSHPASVLGAAVDVSPQALLQSTNRQRQAAHEDGLTVQPLLNKAAQAKADDMVQRNYWSHVSPDGRQPWSFITATGYQYQRAGENLAYGFDSGDTVIRGWMDSPEHRANMLNNTYQEVGFGIAQATNYQGHGPATIVVALYATPPPAIAQDSRATTVASTTVPLDSRPVARVQLIGDTPTLWPLMITYLCGAAAAVVFCLRHQALVKRMLIHGEALVIRHKWVDVCVVSLITLSVVLTRTSGVIR